MGGLAYCLPGKVPYRRPIAEDAFSRHDGGGVPRDISFDHLMSTPHALKVRVGVRLAAGFALLVALTTALGLYCIRGVDRMHAAGDQVATNWFPAMHALAEYRAALDMMRRAEANYVMLNDSARAALELPRLVAARSQADTAWKAYRQTITDDEERRAAMRVEDADARYRAVQERLLRMPLGGRAASEALRETLLGASREVAHDVYDVLGDVVAYQQRGARLSHAAATRDYEETRYVVIGVVSAAVTVAAVVALLIAISIGHDVRSLREGYESALHEESLRASELERANERLVQTNTQLERETRRREAAEDELERLNRRKDEFIATIAHELRGPLSALINAACAAACQWRCRDDAPTRDADRRSAVATNGSPRRRPDRRRATGHGQSVAPLGRARPREGDRGRGRTAGADDRRTPTVAAPGARIGRLAARSSVTTVGWCRC